MHIQIEEIVGRATQGATLPFICRGDDGHFYFVKGRGAGKPSLIREWVAGNLASRFGLPVPPFAIVEVPESLIGLRWRTDLDDLGVGCAFGSRRLDAGLVELARIHLAAVPEALQRDVLAFDLWVRNADRSLGEAGGNPNLFWDQGSSALVVLDHNLAFDPEFSVDEFVVLHAFHGQVDKLQEGKDLQQSYSARFGHALEGWDDICAGIPDAWLFSDAEQTLPVGLDLGAMRKLLLCHNQPNFWKMK